MATHECRVSRIRPEETGRCNFQSVRLNSALTMRKSSRSDRGLGVLKHLTSLLVGANFLQALLLQVALLKLLQPAAVKPPSSDQDAVSFVCIQKHYGTENEGRLRFPIQDSHLVKTNDSGGHADSKCSLESMSSTLGPVPPLGTLAKVCIHKHCFSRFTQHCVT